MFCTYDFISRVLNTKLKSVVFYVLNMNFNQKLLQYCVFPLKSVSVTLFLVAQISARPSFPKRNARRGGRSWRRNEQSVKLLKVLSNLERASWTESGSGGTGRLVRGSEWSSMSVKDQKKESRTIALTRNGGGYCCQWVTSGVGFSEDEGRDRNPERLEAARRSVSFTKCCCYTVNVNNWCILS